MYPEKCECRGMRKEVRSKIKVHLMYLSWAQSKIDANQTYICFYAIVNVSVANVVSGFAEF